jgi:hypothetical protein
LFVRSLSSLLPFSDVDVSAHPLVHWFNCGHKWYRHILMKLCMTTWWRCEL